MASRIQVSLGRNRGFAWSTYAEAGLRAAVKGYAFWDGALFTGQELARKLASLWLDQASGRVVEPSEVALREALLKLNGSFALVVETHQSAFASVDRLRSMPLFYGRRGSESYLSDEADWVREQVHDQHMDELAATEFLLTGYVTGPDTLYPNVKQLQAGEFLLAEETGAISNLRTARFYRYVPGEYYDCPVPELYGLLGDVLERAFRRLLESTNGRTIVVPLSGGRDSRLIVAMLKRFGVENVFCFSYGKPGALDSETSRRVAQTLGYPWEFIPYTPRRFRQWNGSEEFEHYWRYAGGLGSFAHDQDWPAVWELQKAGRIPQEAVFAPGHTVVRQFAIEELAELESVGHALFAEASIRRHYNLWDWRTQCPRLESVMQERVLSLVKDLRKENVEDAASAAECWDWQERQAKFTNHSVRVYEFWGYDWRLPLWDNEIADFWARVPLRLRWGRRLYAEFEDLHLFPPLGLEGGYSSFSSYGSGVLNRARDFLGRWPLCPPFHGVRGYQQLLRAYPVYARRFGYSMPPLRPGLCYIACYCAYYLRLLGDEPARLGGIKQVASSVVTALAVGSLVVRGALTKLRTKVQELFGRRVREPRGLETPARQGVPTAEGHSASSTGTQS